MIPAEQGGFDCGEIDVSADAYLDGELAAEDRLSFDRHLAGCAGCARKLRVHGAFKAALKAAAPRPTAPPALRARVIASLAQVPIEPPAWQRYTMRAIPAAACLALMLGVAVHRGTSSMVRDAAIDTYRRDLPLDVTGPAEAVQAWLHPRVNFAVRPPRLANASLVGARLASLRDHQAAYLVYQVGPSRVSVFVFDPSDLPSPGGRRHQIGNREVLLDADRGYNVALLRDRGVGYAFASDLDEDRMVQLVSSAIGP